MKRASTISRSVEIGLRFIGMWPDSAYPTLYWSVYMTAVAILQYYQYMYVIAHFQLNNLPLLMESLGLALANTLAAFKLLALFWNRQIFHNILAAMDKDWKESVTDNSCESTMVTVAYQSRRYSKVLISIHAVTGFFLTVVAYVVRSIYTVDSIISRELPVKMEFSFDVTKSPLFEFILIGQFIYIFTIASLVGMINALVTTLILHICGQIDIIRQTVLEISNNNNNTHPTAFKKLIYRHRRIITMSDNIENLFSSIALMQLLWNTLIICCSGFMIIIVLSSHKGGTALIKSTLLYFIKMVEVFVFCYAGEILSAKSKSISDALYESCWYNMVPSDSRVLLFIMMRSQKRLTITAGKFFDLTLEGFMSVMKASVSYMSVLHTYYIR